MNLSITYGHVDSLASSVPDFGQVGPMPFNDQWLPYADPSVPQNDALFRNALTANKSTSDQLNGDFKIFDVWDFRPSGTLTTQYNLLSQGTNPVKQLGSTYGLTTIYNKKIFTLPLVKFSLDSAQLQYTHTDTTQYDSSVAPVSLTDSNIASQTTSDLYGLTLPYDIDKGAQGNIHLQRTTGYQNTVSTYSSATTLLDDQGSIEYDQKFAPNLEIHIPFTHWKIQLQDAIELKATFLAEFVNNTSQASLNILQTQRYHSTLQFNYNALKNLRVGIGLTNEYFFNSNASTLNYVLWQGDISAEARF
jgi:hypothetical protein